MREVAQDRIRYSGFGDVDFGPWSFTIMILVYLS
jgi:hypothetical protein